MVATFLAVVALLAVAPTIWAQASVALPDREAPPDRAALRTVEEGRRAELDRALREREWEQAERLLAAEIERAPASPELLKLLAGVFMRDRKPLNAAIAIKKAEALGPLDAATRFQLALAYIALHRRDWARPELERLESAEPDNVLYTYWHARLDYDAGQYASAIRRLKTVIEKQPSFMRAYDNLGLCYEAQNQPEEALRHYTQAVRLNRDVEERSPWPPLNYGVLLLSRGERAEAEALFREALSYDAGFAPAHYRLGTLLEDATRPADALEALNRAAAADASYAEPHYALARIYRRLGRAAEAEAALATFRRLHEAKRQERP